MATCAVARDFESRCRAGSNERCKGTDEIDPTRSNVLGVAPVLVVYPLLESADFYHKKLGFSHPQLLGDPLSVAVLERDGFFLYLQEAEAEVTISPSGSWDIVLRVENVQVELDLLRTLGVPIERGPIEVVHGIRQWTILEIIDPNGYEICIKQESWLTSANPPQIGRT